ncbi:hypothetical protein EUGRSUZ_K02370 [Eucalyptus grandis]|uniref:Uncharacterized protein n=2 Tax=Eucalyptus grandis TaxID=71139 RepID=A0ACC3IWE6_EUCGR|nr:hypothetical protein EUGRSUZ_K02370 [Eucalyptus grandis]
MESKTFSSGSNFSRRSEGEGEHFCFCGFPSPRRTSWTRTNPGRRFYGCARYREGSKCKYFKWVDAKFSHRATEVILDLLDGCHQPPSTLVDDLNDVDSMQAQAQASSVNHLKNEVAKMKIERKCYQAFIVLLFLCLSYFMMKCNGLEDEQKFLQLP